ncbi:LysR family transcriptional regulator [Ruegeria arenilitoris]|uniref:LysR family transcriptional regulator n=1 Tax=Ruegeria arenilitoris TaxID=1173585 RepID=UPI00147BC531|nr:LysR family transcriptional regulator [Ruegeria arenilitoris]
MKTIPITLSQIRFILAVAEEGSTAAAARQLNISQPSVSLAISRVEDELGYPLFVRRPGLGMELTAQGARKLVELRAAYQNMSQIFSRCRDQNELAGSLSIGFMTTLGPVCVPRLVRKFQELHPSVRIKLHEGNLSSLSNWLEIGRIESAIVYDFGLPTDLEILALQDVRPYGVVWQGHPLADRESIAVQDLLRDPLILINLPGSKEYFQSLLQSHETKARIAFETESVEFLRSAVANRLGVGLLATDLPYDVTYDGGKVVRLPLNGYMSPHRVALARNPDFLETQALRAFRAVCLDEFTS